MPSLQKIAHNFPCACALASATSTRSIKSSVRRVTNLRLELETAKE